MSEVINIGPQPGPQSDFLASEADIAIFGGSAGGGKSHALLLEPLRHFHNGKFGCVIFRRNSVQVRNEGGLWQSSEAIYRQFGGHPREAFLDWSFPSNMRVKFAHLELDRSVFDWQGSQIALIGFDELTTFSERQFTFMMSRNRSDSGVPGYIRATCNPDADSWVRKWIDWWIGEDGYPISERAGVLRWFIRQNDQMIWASSKEELTEKYGATQLPKSLTFIPSKVFDNKILMERDPSYLSNLMALPRVDRLRLLDGNWNVRYTAGELFRREWFPVVDAIPSGWIRAVRFWDRAATKPNEQNKDPDWTRGLLLYRYGDGTFLVADLRSTRDTPGQVENLITSVAHFDGRSVRVMSAQDPGSAGVFEAHHFIKSLVGFDVRTAITSKDKVTRSKPVSAQAEAKNIKILRAPWNEEFFNELENFPDGAHDDIVDVLSGAFDELAGGLSIADAYL